MEEMVKKIWMPLRHQRPLSHPHHEFLFSKPRRRSGIDRAAERLVPEPEARFPRRCPAVFSFDNYGIGSAYPYRDGFHKHRAVPYIRFGDIFQSCGSCFSLAQQ
jgi:hypothetical protein